MRNIAICGEKVANSYLNHNIIDRIELEGIPVYCGLVNTSKPKFNPHQPENRFRVLVKKTAFSCNYRDKQLILKMACLAQNKPELQSRFIAVGSEFVGEVIDVGLGVKELKAGDRVIGNNQYPDSGEEGILGGVPTSHASKEYQVFHQVKLMKIPAEMPDEVAAAFSMGAQTAYSMIRKLDIKKGSNILVTAARSNTSLFVIQALQKYQANVYVTTTSSKFDPQLLSMGVKEIIHVTHNCKGLVGDDAIDTIFEEIEGFDCIIDPFFDLHIDKLIAILVPGGKYITCGLYDQYLDIVGQKTDCLKLDATNILIHAFLGNIQIIGNCMGEKTDLENAIADYSSGILKIQNDSVFSGEEIRGFFERTYQDSDRFGKVIYRYD